MNNFIRTTEWLKLAMGDLETAFMCRAARDFDAAVYHLQQAVEKGCKAVIVFLGEEFEPTHFPAQQIILENILERPDEIERLSLGEKEIELLRQIAVSSKLLEEQETIPRYGIEKEGRIILPEEIYTEEKTNYLFDSAGKALWSIYNFLKNFGITELEEVLENARALFERF